MGECFPHIFIQDIFEDICREAPGGLQIHPGSLPHSALFSSMTGHIRSGMHSTPWLCSPTFPTSKRLREHQTWKEIAGNVH